MLRPAPGEVHVPIGVVQASNFKAPIFVVAGVVKPYVHVEDVVALDVPIVSERAVSCAADAVPDKSNIGASNPATKTAACNQICNSLLPDLRTVVFWLESIIAPLRMFVCTYFNALVIQFNAYKHKHLSTGSQVLAS